MRGEYDKYMQPKAAINLAIITNVSPSTAIFDITGTNFQVQGCDGLLHCQKVVWVPRCVHRYNLTDFAGFCSFSASASAPGSPLAPTAPNLPSASAMLACHVTRYLTHTYTYLSISVLFIISVTLYISPYPQEDPYPFLFGSPARYLSCLN